MSNLRRSLKCKGYDLLLSPERDYKLLQIWKLNSPGKIELFADNISDLFDSDDSVSLRKLPDPVRATDIDASSTVELSFSAAVSVLKGLIQGVDIGLKGQSTSKLKRTVSLSFNDVFTSKFETLKIQQYFHHTNFVFKDNSPYVTEPAKKADLLLVTGLMTAISFKIIINCEAGESDEFEADLKALNIKGSNIIKASSTVTLTSPTSPSPLPIAVMAHRLDFDGRDNKPLYLDRLPRITEIFDIF